MCSPIFSPRHVPTCALQQHPCLYAIMAQLDLHRQKDDSSNFKQTWKHTLVSKQQSFDGIF